MAPGCRRRSWSGDWGGTGISCFRAASRKANDVGQKKTKVGHLRRKEIRLGWGTLHAAIDRQGRLAAFAARMARTGKRYDNCVKKCHVSYSFEVLRSKVKIFTFSKIVQRETAPVVRQMGMHYSVPPFRNGA